MKRYDGSLVSKYILTVLCILQQIFAVDQNTPETQGTFWIRYGREDLKKLDYRTTVLISGRQRKV